MPIVDNRIAALGQCLCAIGGHFGQTETKRGQGGRGGRRCACPDVSGEAGARWLAREAPPAREELPRARAPASQRTRVRAAGMPCAFCQRWIGGWATFREEDGEWVAFCAPCNAEDSDFKFDSHRKRQPWTQRVVCSDEECQEAAQSCRVTGGGPTYCLRLHGWQRSRRGFWYCPRHARAWLNEPEPLDKECLECDCDIGHQQMALDDLDAKWQDVGDDGGGGDKGAAV